MLIVHIKAEVIVIYRKSFSYFKLQGCLTSTCTCSLYQLNPLASTAYIDPTFNWK